VGIGAVTCERLRFCKLRICLSKARSFQTADASFPLGCLTTSRFPGDTRFQLLSNAPGLFQSQCCFSGGQSLFAGCGEDNRVPETPVDFPEMIEIVAIALRR